MLPSPQHDMPAQNEPNAATNVPVSLASKIVDRRGLSAGPVTLFILGVLWAMFYLWHTGLLWEPALYEEPNIGRHLARGEGFLSPYDLTATAPPTSWSPPVYPFTIGVVYRVLGVDSSAASLTLSALNALCFGAVGAGLVVLGRCLFWPPVGYVAAALFYVHPMFLRATGKFWDAYPALAIFIWLIIAATAMRRGRATPLRMAGLGAGLGALVLINASYGLAIPLLIVIAAGGQGWLRAVRLAGVAVLAFVLVLTPWTLRNYVIFKRVWFVRGGADMELWFGNLPGATGWLNSYSFDAHPGHDPVEHRRLLEWGEPKYFEYCGERFCVNYGQDPGAFWRRSLHRVGYLFLSDPTDPAHYPLMPDWKWHGVVVSRVGLNGLVTALGLAGAWVAWWLGYRTHWLIGLAVLSVTPFMVTAVWDRHTMPLRLLLLLFMAFVLSAVVHRWRRGWWPRPAPVLPIDQLPLVTPVVVASRKTCETKAP